MIADLDETLRQLIIAEIPIKNGEIEISFHQPRRDWSSRISKPTLNLFLYDVRENNKLRQHQWETASPVTGGNLAHLKRSPFRVDCSYMLTAWAAEPEDEHRLLTRCMMALFRYPVLPEERMVGGMKHQPFEVQTHLALHDRLTNASDLWSALDNEMKPSVPYTVTLALDPWSEVTGPIVRTLVLRSGQTDWRTLDRRFDQERQSAEMVSIGGTLWKNKKGGEVLAGVEVALKGTGFFGRTDGEGRFVLGSTPAGAYTMVAWLPGDKVVQKKITIPASDGDNDWVIG